MATKATDALPMRGWLTGRVVITATSTLQSKIVQQASTSETSIHLRVGKTVSQFHQFLLSSKFCTELGVTSVAPCEECYSATPAPLLANTRSSLYVAKEH